MKLRNLIIILVVLAIALGVIFYFLTNQNTANPTTGGQTGSLPNPGTQQIPSGNNATGTTGGNFGVTTGSNGTSSSQFGVISSEPALDYFVDASNNTEIVEPNGTIEVVTGGKATVLSSSPIQSIASANFSYDGKKVLVVFGDPNQEQISVFDMTTKAWTPITTTMQSPVWSPNSYQVAYLSTAPNGQTSIMMQNLQSTSTRPTTLATMNFRDMSLVWASKDSLVIADRPSAYTSGSAWIFSIANKTLTPVAMEYPGMESLWNVTTSTVGIVFSGNNANHGGHLNLVNTNGNIQALAFVTLPTKCLFYQLTTSSTSTPSVATSTVASSTKKVASTTIAKTTSSTITSIITVSTTSLTLYCAVPRDQQTLSIARLPDEYEQKVLFTADDFYKMDPKSGALSEIFSDPSQTLDAVNLKVFNNTLFFINRYDQKLYAISLGTK